MCSKKSLRDVRIILKNEYYKWFEIFFVIAFLFFILVISIFIGTIASDIEIDWAIFSMTDWAYAGCATVAFFIILDIIFYGRIFSSSKTKTGKNKSRRELINGKKVYTFTHPKEIKWGPFSKTYIQIDEDHILNIRFPINPYEKTNYNRK